MYFIVSAVNILISLIFGRSLKGLMDTLGNLSTIEAAVLFILGGIRTVFRSASWSGLENLLKISSEKWSIEDMKDSEKKGLVYILTAILLVLEAIILAYINLRM
jgi:hypothetical protein